MILKAQIVNLGNDEYKYTDLKVLPREGETIVFKFDSEQTSNVYRIISVSHQLAEEANIADVVLNVLDIETDPTYYR